MTLYMIMIAAIIRISSVSSIMIIFLRIRHSGFLLQGLISVAVCVVFCRLCLLPVILILLYQPDVYYTPFGYIGKLFFLLKTYLHGEESSSEKR